MLDEVKKQRIIQLVQSSNILTAQEKTDWLSLLELMNDKQIVELEEILKPKAVEVPVTKPVPTPKSFPTMPKPVIIKPRPIQTPLPNKIEQPSLKHISNLPNQISSEHAFESSITRAGAITKPSIVNPTAKPEQVKPLQTKPPVNVESKPSTEIKQMQALSITKIEDLASVTKIVLTQDHRKNFYTIILGLAGQYGYFQVLNFFEQSSLYKDYISYGRIKLSSENNRELPLTQEEFEFMTDLLLALKVNRV